MKKVKFFRCQVKGCGQFFHGGTDLKKHEAFYHCKKCGWGTPQILKSVKICEACLWEIEPVPKDAKPKKKGAA